MLPEEVEFFKSFIQILNYYRSEILLNLLSFKTPNIFTNGFGKELKDHKEEPKEIKTSSEAPSEYNYRKVKIINPIPSFIGTDLKVYGPYSENETASLPGDVVDLLLRKNMVVLNENS